VDCEKADRDDDAESKSVGSGRGGQDGKDKVAVCSAETLPSQVEGEGHYGLFAKFSHEKELACSGELGGVDSPTEEAPDEAPPLEAFAWKRVRAQIESWRAIEAKPSLLRVIELGVPLEWGPTGETKPFDHGESMENGTEDEKLIIDEEVRSLIKKGAIKVSVFPAKYVSRLFLVDKSDGGRRAVIDLSHLNKSIRKYSMSMQTLHFVAKIAQPTDWMLSCDVKDGYYHLAIREGDQRFLQFRWRGVIYQYMGLPMGYSLAPYWFCTLMFAWVRYAQAQWSVRILSYVDDFLFFFVSATHARNTREKIDGLLKDLGIKRHPTKGNFDEPVRELLHLGMIIDLENNQFRAPVQKLARLKKMCKATLFEIGQNKGKIRVRVLASLAGLGNHLSIAINGARLHLREVYNVIGPRVGRQAWTGKAQVTYQLKKELEFWKSLDLNTIENGLDIFARPVTCTIHLDSSLYGWGAVFTEGDFVQEAQSHWEETDLDSSPPIHLLELKTVRKAILPFGVLLENKVIRVHEDNQICCAVLQKNHFTSPIPEIMNELRELKALMNERRIELCVAYIRSEENVRADALSRIREHAVVKMEIFNELKIFMARPVTIDRFATAANAKVPRFNSLYLEPTAEARDALSITDTAWAKEVNWCFPPINLLNRLVTKLRTSGAEAWVVCPARHFSPFYANLMLMRTSAAFAILRYTPHQLFSRRGLGGQAKQMSEDYEIIHIPRRRPQNI
jgi:hypothetical protein